MDPGYRSPLIDMFRRDGNRETRLLAAQGDLGAGAHDQLALLMMLIDDADPDVAMTALSTVQRLPLEPLRAFLARADVPAEIREYFAAMGITPADVAAPDASAPLTGDDDDEDEEQGEAKEGAKAESKLLAGLPIKKKIKLASKGTREQRAQLIRDPNKLVAGAVLSSPKLTDAEVESFAKMANVAEEVLRVIGNNRTWLKNYGVALGLVKNPEDPARHLHAAPAARQRARHEDARGRPQRARVAAAGGAQVHRQGPQVGRFLRFQSFLISARPSMKTVARWRSSGSGIDFSRSMARSKSRSMVFDEVLK